MSQEATTRTTLATSTAAAPGTTVEDMEVGGPVPRTETETGAEEGGGTCTTSTTTTGRTAGSTSMAGPRISGIQTEKGKVGEILH